uniref:BTB domain-containing protein n=1 Tax=Panagrolaimus sp. ES5 TaxID=591445 RepID=A0AC34F7D5_9BILA
MQKPQKLDLETMKNNATKHGNAINLHWIIPKFEIQKKSAFKSETIACHRIEGLSYYLKFFPNQNGNAVIAFKFINEIKDIIDFKTTFFIKSAGFEKELTGDYQRDFLRKIGKSLPIKFELVLCSTKDLYDEKQHFFDQHDELNIQCEGLFTYYEFSPEYSSPDRWRFKSGKKSMQPYRRVEYDWDIKLIAKNGIVECHKWVLATRAKFFNDMYTSDEQLDVTEFEMKEFDVKIVQIAVILCYDQTKMISPPRFEEKLELLRFFYRYPIQKYKAELEEHMMTIIDETNVCLIAQAAIDSHCSKLKNKCAKYMKLCAQNNVPITDLNQLDEKFRLKVLKTLFMHETLTY